MNVAVSLMLVVLTQPPLLARAKPSGSAVAPQATARADVDSCIYSPDGKFLVTFDAHGISIWKTGPQLVLAKRHGGRINTVAFSRDSRRLLIGGISNGIVTYETATWRPGPRIELPVDETAAVHSLAYSPDGRHWAAGISEHRIVVLDAMPAEATLSVIDLEMEFDTELAADDALTKMEAETESLSSSDPLSIDRALHLIAHGQGNLLSPYLETLLQKIRPLVDYATQVRHKMSD